MCIPTIECPFTRQLKAFAKLSSNEKDRNSILEIISSKHCGKLSEETVCCDANEGMLCHQIRLRAIKTLHKST